MLFDEQGEVSLADFGIARVAYDSSVTSTGEILGTAAYISPEQADGKTATEASDVYGLAVVAFELLTGERPFSTGNFAATARMHVEAPPPRATDRDPDLPPAVDAVLARGMAKDPADRFPTATALVDALETALKPGPAPIADVEEDKDGSTVVMPPPPPPPPPDDPGEPEIHGGRRRPRAALLLVGLALAALLIGTIGLIAGGGGGDKKSLSASEKAAKAQRDARAERRAKRRERAREQARLEGQTPATATPPAGQDEQPSGSDTQSTPDQPTSGQPSQPAQGGGDPAALNEQGFGLMNSGRYGEAIPVLQQAVSSCGNDVSDLTCAYATFNLAKALRLAGRPAEAIPLLQRRLQNPDQRGEVEAELAQAKAAAGDRGVDTGPGRGAGKPGKGPKRGKGKKD
jgi:serine/threonine-protein kinase